MCLCGTNGNLATWGTSAPSYYSQHLIHWDGLLGMSFQHLQLLAKCNCNQSIWVLSTHEHHLEVTGLNLRVLVFFVNQFVLL